MVIHIKSRKRKHMGNRSFGGGNAKNRRGKGNKGGVGNAGAGKHHRLRVIKTVGSTKAQKGLSGFYNHNETKVKEISLATLNYLLIRGSFKENDGEVVLKGFKVLSNGSLTHKIKSIKASAFTKKAVEKLAALGVKTEALK